MHAMNVIDKKNLVTGRLICQLFSLRAHLRIRLRALSDVRMAYFQHAERCYAKMRKFENIFNCLLRIASMPTRTPGAVATTARQPVATSNLVNDLRNIRLETDHQQADPIETHDQQADPIETHSQQADPPQMDDRQADWLETDDQQVDWLETDDQQADRQSEEEIDYDALD